MPTPVTAPLAASSDSESWSPVVSVTSAATAGPAAASTRARKPAAARMGPSLRRPGVFVEERAEERPAAVDLPAPIRVNRRERSTPPMPALTCPGCQARFAIPGPGRYKCTKCGTPLPEVTDDRTGTP